MKKEKQTGWCLGLLLYLSFLTIAIAGTIHFIEITTSTLACYEAMVRIVFLVVQGGILLLIWKLAIVKKLHQTMKKEKEMKS